MGCDSTTHIAIVTDQSARLGQDSLAHGLAHLVSLILMGGANKVKQVISQDLDILPCIILFLC